MLSQKVGATKLIFCTVGGDDGGDGEDDDGGDLHASDIVVVETRLQFEDGGGGKRDHV